MIEFDDRVSFCNVGIYVVLNFFLLFFVFSVEIIFGRLFRLDIKLDSKVRFKRWYG